MSYGSMTIRNLFNNLQVLSAVVLIVTTCTILGGPVWFIIFLKSRSSLGIGVRLIDSLLETFNVIVMRYLR
jgi:hypothetical protein